EADSKVLFQYKSVDFGDGSATAAGASATVGIRNAGGLASGEQLPWSFDVAVIGNESAVMFTTGGSAPIAPSIAVTGGTFVYDGSPHAATAMATGTGGAAVPGSFAITYAPGGSTPPVNGGTYAVTVAFTSGDPGYTDASGSTTIVITPATPV